MPGGCRNGDVLTTGHGCSTSAKSISTQSNVYINGKPVVRKGDPVEPHTIQSGSSCVAHSAKVNKGSPDVYLNGIKVARIKDSADMGAMVQGSGNVFLNEAHLTRDTIRFDGVGIVGNNAGRQFTKILDKVEKFENKPYDVDCCSYYEIPTVPTRAEVEELTEYLWGLDFKLIQEYVSEDSLTIGAKLVPDFRSESKDGSVPIAIWDPLLLGDDVLYTTNGTLDEMKTRYIKSLISNLIVHRTNFKELLSAPIKLFFGGVGNPIYLFSTRQGFNHYSESLRPDKNLHPPSGGLLGRYKPSAENFLIFVSDTDHATDLLESVYSFKNGRWGYTVLSSGEFRGIKTSGVEWGNSPPSIAIHESVHAIGNAKNDVDSLDVDTLKKVKELAGKSGVYWFSILSDYSLIGYSERILHTFEDEFLARVAGQMMNGSCVTIEDVLKSVPGLLKLFSKTQIAGLEIWWRALFGFSYGVVRTECKGIYKELFNEDQKKQLIKTKRQKLKEHIRKFFKDLSIAGDPIFDNYLKTFGLDEELLDRLGKQIYKDREKFEKDFNDFVENSVNELPDDANILDNPNFYLPIIANQVPMLAAEWLVLANGMVQPKEQANSIYFPSSQVATGVAVDTYWLDFGGITGESSRIDASKILSVAIHEYSHTEFNIADYDPYLNYTDYDIITFEQLKDPSNETSFTKRNKSYIVIPEKFRSFDGPDLPANEYYAQNLTALYKGDKTSSGPFNEMGGYMSQQLIDETMSRVKAAAGTRSNHNSLDDMFSPEDQKKLFQPKFIKLLNKHGWP